MCCQSGTSKAPDMRDCCYNTDGDELFFEMNILIKTGSATTSGPRKLPSHADKTWLVLFLIAPRQACSTVQMSRCRKSSVEPQSMHHAAVSRMCSFRLTSALGFEVISGVIERFVAVVSHLEDALLPAGQRARQHCRCRVP